MKIDRLDGYVIALDPKIGSIRLGFGNNNIIDHKYERAIWANTGTIEFRGTASLGVGCRISNNGYLVVGDNFRVNGTTSIVCQKEIEFGNNDLISWECLIMDSDYHKIYKLHDDKHKQINEDKKIIFGNHVWMGCRCTVLKGSSVPNDSVIAAGSIISGKLEGDNTIYSGNIAIKRNIEWKGK